MLTFAAEVITVARELVADTLSIFVFLLSSAKFSVFLRLFSYTGSRLRKR